MWLSEPEHKNSGQTNPLTNATRRSRNPTVIQFNEQMEVKIRGCEEAFHSARVMYVVRFRWNMNVVDPRPEG